MEYPKSVVVLDACCAINLYATGQMAAILRVIGAQFVIVAAVMAEALYIRRGGQGDDAQEREWVELQPLVDEGLLVIWQPDDPAEAATFVQLAVDLDDGEAMTCALAIHRGAEVATDDRKALRILAQRYANRVPVRTTAALLKEWAEACQLDALTLRPVLLAVRQRARFAPGRHDPLQAWWESGLQPDG